MHLTGSKTKHKGKALAGNRKHVMMDVQVSQEGRKADEADTVPETGA